MLFWLKLNNFEFQTLRIAFGKSEQKIIGEGLKVCKDVFFTQINQIINYFNDISSSFSNFIATQ